ncbi:MAG TPA: hypothetical protein VMU06_11880 [Stellaceae bacterium]|nr:hypothetical protein [Stellaceae bacterium]
MDMNNFQRIGSISNAHVGSEFEGLVQRFFANQGVVLSSGFAVPIGVGNLKKSRKFDFGSEQPPIIVECKSHNWTSGGNVPSAKMTVWNEAMFYFQIAPDRYRKVLFSLRSIRRSESLAAYYVRCFAHLIPAAVEIWEYDVATHAAERLK